MGRYDDNRSRSEDTARRKAIVAQSSEALFTSTDATVKRADSDRRERELFSELTAALLKLNVAVQPVDLTDDTPRQKVYAEVERRRTILTAVLLGIEVSPEATHRPTEQLIRRNLPNILVTRGLDEGVTVRMGFGRVPEEPHVIVDTSCVSANRVYLQDVDGVEIDCAATLLAIHATIVEPAS